MLRVRHVVGAGVVAVVTIAWALGTPAWVAAGLAVTAALLFFWVPLARGETYKVVRLLLAPFFGLAAAVLVAAVLSAMP